MQGLYKNVLENTLMMNLYQLLAPISCMKINGAQLICLGVDELWLKYLPMNLQKRQREGLEQIIAVLKKCLI